MSPTDALLPLAWVSRCNESILLILQSMGTFTGTRQATWPADTTRPLPALSRWDTVSVLLWTVFPVRLLRWYGVGPCRCVDVALLLAFLHCHTRNARIYAYEYMYALTFGLGGRFHVGMIVHIFSLLYLRWLGLYIFSKAHSYFQFLFTQKYPSINIVKINIYTDNAYVMIIIPFLKL